MERLTHEADFGLEEWEQTLYFVNSDQDGAYNILDIANQEGEEEFDEILKTISLGLKHYEDTGLTPKQIMELKERDTAMEINEIHVDEYYCPACGSENNCDQGVVEDNFCPRCGHRLKKGEERRWQNY